MYIYLFDTTRVTATFDVYELLKMFGMWPYIFLFYYNYVKHESLLIYAVKS